MEGPRVAIIGTGQMGSAAARRLVGLGYSLVLWNRTRRRAEELGSSIGVRVASTLEEAVGHVEYGLVFLLDDDAVAWLATSLPRSDGLVLVNHSTNTPRMSIAVARRLEALGICYVEAPVIGGPHTLEEGKAKILVAGESRCLRRAASILRDLASSIVETGPLGSAMAAKLAYNMVLMTSLAVLGEAVLLADSHGVGLGVLGEVMRGTPMESLSKYLARVAGREDPGGARMHVAAKDLEHAGRALYDSRIPGPVSAAAGNLYRIGLASGCESYYYGATAKILQGCRGSRIW
ncbi:MAG: NAD(P)-dependent oxidoreductase [Desulfurococcales archaeon]|nr:NAD(P)-dependent oxidoreductase [Desulfurococcales archaeon]